MQNNIQSTIYWKTKGSSGYLAEDINEVAAEPEYFSVKCLHSKENCFAEKYDIEILLKKDYAPDIIYKARINFDKDEHITKFYRPFIHFDHKSLSSGQYIVVTNRRHILVKPEKPYPFLLNQTSDTLLEIEVVIDAPFLHPSWDLSKGQRESSAAPLQKAGTCYGLCYTFFYTSLQEQFIPVHQHLYPFAKKAAFILTDHCDFDNAKKLELFLYGNNEDGWIGKGLKISKGVFTLAPKPGEERKNDSLEDLPYAKLIEDLHKDGSEIVPHALKSKGQLSSEMFHTALKKLVNLYHPKTWIDHGSYLKYCYSQGAKYNPDYTLIETLQENKFNNLWSYHDVNTDALDTLNIFSATRFGTKRIVAKIIQHILRGKLLVSAHYTRSIFHRDYRKNIITDFLIYAMACTKGIFISWQKGNKNIFKLIKDFFTALRRFGKYRNNIPVPYSNKALLKYAPPLYCEDRKPFTSYANNDLLMFSTFETTHLQDIYNQDALDKLINEYGTHIGHTYILNDLPYLNHIFTGKGKAMKLSEKWIRFTEILSLYIKKNLVWNPNMGEYVSYINVLQNVGITYINCNKISIYNSNAEKIEGYTLMIPAEYRAMGYVNGHLSEAASSNGHYHFFVFDLSPGKSEFEYHSAM